MSTQIKRDASNNKRKLDQRKKIMRGRVTPLFGLLAIVCVVFGVLNSTIWKPSPRVDAQALVRSQYIVTDPGVLDLVDESTTITASIVNAGSDKREKNQICMAIGSAQDAAGWVSGQTYERIKGLDDWTHLSTGSEQIASKTPAKTSHPVDFRNSDMWQQVKCGTSSVSLNVTTNQTGQVAIINIQSLGESGQGKGAKAKQPQPEVKVHMHWTRHKLPNFAMPFYFAGALLGLLAGLSATVFAMEPAKRRKSKVSQPEEKPQVSILEAFASFISPVFAKDSKNAGRRSRHGAGVKEGPKRAPKVVDVGAKNMVAEQQKAKKRGEAGSNQQAESNEHNHDDSLQSYLERLANENAGRSRLRKGRKGSRTDFDDTGDIDIDDSTVGAAGGAYADNNDGDLDDRTNVDYNDGFSDETTEVDDDVQPTYTRAQSMQAIHRPRPRR